MAVPEEQTTGIILDSIADGVFTVDKDWRITSFNRAAERITGVPRQEAVGRRCCDIFHSSVCENECALLKTTESGKPIVNKAIYIVTAAGQRVPISISTALLRDRSGEVIGGVETFRDLSMVEELRKELRKEYTFADIIGRSRAMRQIFQILPQVARSDSTVLIQGSSGTGKEIVARAIHNLSPRNKGRFVAVNCGALPDTLLESELFGHRAGAFTDARRDRPGRFAVAKGGTILLDEIGDVSPAMQTRLLRVLQERTFEPLGSTEPVRADVRVIAASNKNLASLVKKGAFREDLYYRVNVVRLALPDLRDRREDVPLFIEHFVAKFNRLQNRDLTGISDEAMACLMEHNYPGNVRELENIVEHAFVLCPSGTIQLHHLPPELREGREGDPPRATRGLSLESLEAAHIEDALRRNTGNRSAAARELGIHPSTLFRKVKSLAIPLPEKDGRSRKRT